jgi:integrase
MKEKERVQPKQQRLINRGENLYQADITGIYYCIFKQDGKTYKWSLETDNWQTAKIRRDEKRKTVGHLKTGDAAKMPFSVLDDDRKIIGGLLVQYIATKIDSMKPKTKDTNLDDCQILAEAFNGRPVRNIDLAEIETWAAKYRKEVAAGTFNRRLGLLRRIFDYAVKHHIRMDNPASKENIDRAEDDTAEAIQPTKEEFTLWINEIARFTQESSEFTEAEGYSGCRVSEIGGDKEWGFPPMTWGNINFNAGTFTVVGKGRGKLRKTRTVPLFPAFRELLLRRRARLFREPQPTDRVFAIQDPRNAQATACKRLGWDERRFTNHDCRHFFCSNAIELGYDYKVIAHWLGHSDGGILVARTYGHLRQTHSMQLAQGMTWMAGPPPATNIADMPPQTRDNGDGDGEQPRQPAVNE